MTRARILRAVATVLAAFLLLPAGPQVARGDGPPASAEVFSDEFRFTSILDAEISPLYVWLNEFIANFEHEFTLLEVLGDGSSDREIFTSSGGCFSDSLETSCDPGTGGPVTDFLGGEAPQGHVDGETIYRLRARTRWFNEQGLVDAFEDDLFFITFAVAHQRGDYNLDGQVDAADYTVWRDAEGDTLVAADGNRDGVVDGADYQVFVDRYGQSVDPPFAPSAAVPEPVGSALLLWLLAVHQIGSIRQR